MPPMCHTRRLFKSIFYLYIALVGDMYRILNLVYFANNAVLKTVGFGVFSNNLLLKISP